MNYTFKIIRVAAHHVATTGPVNYLVMVIVCSVIALKNSMVISVRFSSPVSNLEKISLKLVYRSTKE